MPITEDDLEQTAIGWFRELGWEYAHGETISPGGFAPERAHYNGALFETLPMQPVSR